MNGCKPVVRGGLSNLYYAAEEKRIQKVNRRGGGMSTGRGKR
jgi:hypothetical protein